MFSLRDLLLLWSSRIQVSSYEMFLHCSYIVHWEMSLRKSHYIQCCSFFYPLVCSECIFLRNSRECLSIEGRIHEYNAVIYIAVSKNRACVKTNLAKTNSPESKDVRNVTNSSVIQISSVAFLEQRVLNLWLYISNKYNSQNRFYLYTKQFFLSSGQTKV